MRAERRVEALRRPARPSASLRRIRTPRPTLVRRAPVQALRSVVGGRAPVMPARILLVEDDDDIRGALAMLFEQSGYVVETLHDGTAFVERICGSILLEELRPPDVIITDVRLPGSGFDGLGVVEGLRQAGWWLPVFVISAWPDDEVRARVDALGLAEFFPKPIDLDRLEASVRKALETRAYTGGTRSSDDGPTTS